MNHSNKKGLTTNRKFKPVFLYYSVLDAPFKIGAKVTTLDNPNNDETFNKQFSFKTGMIIYFEYECGCGQTFPSDPMIGVKFSDGKIEEFWKEELSLIL